MNNNNTININNCNTSTMMMDNINNNNNGLYPMIMFPPLQSHPHNYNHTSNHNNNNIININNNNNNINNNKIYSSSNVCYDHLMDMENQHNNNIININNSSSSNNNNNNNNNNNINNNINNSIKAKIMGHPHYPRLLSAFVNCQKVGAPPEVVGRLEEVERMRMNEVGGGRGGYIGEDPSLDQFMEAYCEMLTKYEQELTKPFKEAMLFLSTIDSQFKTLTLSSSSNNSPSGACVDIVERNVSSDEENDANNSFIDSATEDRELKGQLLRKYSGYLGSLRQEFMKKRKKGKLPKEARQQLLDWWSRHYKWPYPSESQKLALAEATGLDQKQINNWFINQRKRHWKPSEDMQLVVMDAAHGHPHYGNYMDNVIANHFPMDVPPTLM